MASILFGPNQFSAAVSEIVGYKSGLALSDSEMRELLQRQRDLLLEYWPESPDDSVRIRSESLEAIVSCLLFCVGATKYEMATSPGLYTYHKYKADLRLSAIERDVVDSFLLASEEHEKQSRKLSESRVTAFDAMHFVKAMGQKHGSDGLTIASEFMEVLQHVLTISITSKIRQLEWKDLVELNALFKSESLETSHGTFLDQRFIEYLGQQFDDIDNINWRKFEGLVGEFFERAGYNVEMGPGRNDNGVDIRIWHSGPTKAEPPLVLIQCKREKTKVNKTVVKALWADVASEKASSGLIVTSSSFSPGAAKVCTARSYPIIEANRAMLKKWIDLMRRPNAGVVFGE